jgi:TonB family protein
VGFYRKKKPSEPVEQTGIPEKKAVTKDTDLVYYVQLVKKRIYTQWIIPGALRSQQQVPIVTMSVKILKNGTLIETEFINRSDNELLNRSILDAIKNSTPFPSFPTGMDEDSLEIIINFDINS